MFLLSGIGMSLTIQEFIQKNYHHSRHLPSYPVNISCSFYLRNILQIYPLLSMRASLSLVMALPISHFGGGLRASRYALSDQFSVLQSQKKT